MKIAITAQMRNGLLWEAVKRAGSQRALAEQLGVSQSALGHWLNFRGTGPAYYMKGHAKRYAELEKRMVEVVGATLDQVFPPELRSERFQQKQKRVESLIDVPVENLIASGAMPALPPMPDDAVFAQEGKEAIRLALETLRRPRDRQVLQMRFGLEPYSREHTLEEIGLEMGISGGRVRMLEVRALRELRHPSISRPLRPWGY